jgi:hypothetical protein
MIKLPRRAVAGGLVALLAFAGAACSDDDEEPTETGDAPEETTTTGAEETTTTEATDETDGGDAAGVIEIIGTNTADSYTFEDVPTEAVPVGSKLSLTNTGTEPHEIIAILIPESETRSVDEIAALSEEEQTAIFGAEPEPATVVLAATGTTDTPGAVVGDGTINEPGRYALLCFLPTGSTDAILESDGPPAESEAPPHVALGMFAELTVE